jgi:hypothetical protein
MKESYENMAHLLNKINYKKYKWHISADLKVVAILVGLQLGYTKHCCFLCEWDSRARLSHYVVKQWSKRKQHIPGQKNIIHPALVDREKFF